jgi:hypothetical protein
VEEASTKPKPRPPLRGLPLSYALHDGPYREGGKTRGAVISIECWIALYDIKRFYLGICSPKECRMKPEIT